VEVEADMLIADEAWACCAAIFRDAGTDAQRDVPAAV